MNGHGVDLVELGEGWQILTRAEYTEAIERAQLAVRPHRLKIVDAGRGPIPGSCKRAAYLGSRNEYVVGWIKRGPSGVIGHNKRDSGEVADLVLADLAAAGAGASAADRDAELASWLAQRQPALVTSAHWELIDAHERGAGEPTGRPRVKLTRIEDLLAVAHG